MKYRWLKITGNMVYGTNEITVSDLVRQKEGGYDTIIDVENGTAYDPEQNDWLPIPGDK